MSVAAPASTRRLFTSATDQGLVVWLLVIGLAAQTAFASEFFFTQRNVANLSAQAIPLGLVTLAQMIAIVSGSIDLSVGATAKLSGLLTAGLIADSPIRVVPVLLLVLVVSALVGLGNGLIITRLAVDPLIATFVSFTFVTGAALAYTRTPIGGIPQSLSSLAYDQLGPVPYLVVAFFTLASLLALVLNRTRFGRSLYMVGGDRLVARRNGVQVDRVRIAAMTISSVLAGLAGVVLAFRLGTGEPRAADGFELDSIVAAVLGGTAIAGGKGNVFGVLGGVAFFSLLTNSFNLQDIAGLSQDALKGLVILLAILAFSRRET